MLLLMLGAGWSTGVGQRGTLLYGDLIVDEGDGGEEKKPISYTILLYTLSGYVVSRQNVGANSSYRIINVVDGDYDLVVELENTEIARLRVRIRNPIYKSDMRQDIHLGWKSANNIHTKPASVFAEDFYKRSPANQKSFDKAASAIDKKKYLDAETLLKSLVANDPKDYQAWTELGTVFLYEKNLTEAEKAYRQSLEVRPGFLLALMNLGRLNLMQNRFEEAIPYLSKAVEVKPTSADANYFLGDAYLRIKKGSKAVGYLYEALKLDPVGKAEAHLKLAALYNGAGLKSKAATEYAEFLKKKPDYPDKKKLEQYIAQNKNP